MLIVSAKQEQVQLLLWDLTALHFAPVTSTPGLQNIKILLRLFDFWWKSRLKSIKVDTKKSRSKKMKVEESRKKVELKSTFSRVEKMKVEVDKSTRTFECSTFFRSVHATGWLPFAQLVSFFKMGLWRRFSLVDVGSSASVSSPF